MSETFIDFREVKKQVRIEAVLGRYKIQLRRVNQNSLRGSCPLPTHTSETSKESFNVHTEKHIWACQSTSCAATRQGRKGGNVLDFVSIMEKCSIRDAALTLRDWFLLSGDQSPTTGKRSEATKKLVSEKDSNAGDAENRPLTFTLKEINHAHPYLLERGITEETAKHFEVGYFPGRGSMSGRVVIPIHNDRGELVAYAGRSIDATEPKYRLPAGFKKSVELFNLHRVLALPDESRPRIIVCEGFFDCVKVHQAGMPAVVGLMGSSLSEVQEKYLQKFSCVSLFLDGDEAGWKAAQEIAARLMYKMFVRIVNLPDGKQPDQLSTEEIRSALDS